jgi:hypothetical protein
VRHLLHHVAGALRCEYRPSLCGEPQYCGFVRAPTDQPSSDKCARVLLLLRRLLAPLALRRSASALQFVDCRKAVVSLATGSALRCQITRAKACERRRLFGVRVCVRYTTRRLCDAVVCGAANLRCGRRGTCRWIDDKRGNAFFWVPLGKRSARWLQSLLRVVFVAERVSGFAQNTAFVQNLFSTRCRGTAPCCEWFDLRGYSDLMYRQLRADERIALRSCRKVTGV